MTADAVARCWIVGAHRAPLQLLSSRDYPADPRRKSPPRDQLAAGYFAAPCEITVPDGDCNRNMMAPIPVSSLSAGWKVWRMALKEILKWPLIVAAIVVVLRVIVERAGAPAAVSNMLSVAALTTVLGPLYFALQIGLAGKPRPHRMLIQLI